MKAWAAAARPRSAGPTRAAGPAGYVWRMLLLAQWREQPGRLLLTIMAIALGVALGSAVYLVNNAALNEFGLATKRLVGEADLVVRGSKQGFPDDVFVRLSQDNAVNMASPVLELDVAIPGRRETLKVIGLDLFRAAALQPGLIGDLGAATLELLQPDAIYLSSSASQELNLHRGDVLPVLVGSTPKALHVLGVLTGSAYSQALGLMDIASAQWTFGQLGRLNRVDIRLRQATSVAAFRDSIAPQLPAGVFAIAAQVELERAKSVTRAYRVNLNMLALVALWTGAFLVFSTQSLAVLRRRASLALLRALGVTRGQLRLALLGEGLLIGAAGSCLGVVAGLSIAAAALKYLTADLGNGQLRTAGASLQLPPMPLLTFIALGTLVAGIGAWLPARDAARRSPARALKGGDDDYSRIARNGTFVGVAVLGVGAVFVALPAVGGLPLFGYASIAALLCGALLLVPTLAMKALTLAPRTQHIVVDTAVAQLRENVGLSVLSLVSIIVSFSLMVAMAIMVYSFRQSFDHWLIKLLPADMQLREPYGNDTAFWSAADQASLAAIAGVARLEFRRTRQLLLKPDSAPVTLIARGAEAGQTAEQLPLIARTKQALPAGAKAAWISEALQDLYGYKPGDSIDLPLAARMQRFTVAGVWRDYARSSGAVVISRAAYIAATGDGSANEGSLWLTDDGSAARVEAAARSLFAGSNSLEITTSSGLRERSLQIFDRAFAITYALEAIAVLIGLAGISFAASSTALARRAEFGMLRHLGMLRRQILGMLASEGVLTSLFGVAYGLLLGTALSLVLVFVINRQSFNWSIDLAIPAAQLAMLCITMIAAAAVTAIGSGRAAMSQDAVRAVREDW